MLSIASGMLTVITIAVLNSVFKESSTQILGITFPMDTDYIAIPAVIVSVTRHVPFVVSLLTPKPLDTDWQDFMGESPVAPAKPSNSV